MSYINTPTYLGGAAILLIAGATQMAECATLLASVATEVDRGRAEAMHEQIATVTAAVAAAYFATGDVSDHIGDTVETHAGDAVREVATRIELALLPHAGIHGELADTTRMSSDPIHPLDRLFKAPQYAPKSNRLPGCC